MLGQVEVRALVQRALGRPFPLELVRLAQARISFHLLAPPYENELCYGDGSCGSSLPTVLCFVFGRTHSTVWLVSCILRRRVCLY